MEQPRAYTLEVFVKSVHAPGQEAIKNCLGVAVRFLDFPMLLVRPSEMTLDDQAVNGRSQEDVYVFSSGKSCVFSSEPDELAAQLSEVRRYCALTRPMLASDMPAVQCISSAWRDWDFAITFVGRPVYHRCPCTSSSWT